MAFKEKAFGAAKALWQAASRTPPSQNKRAKAEPPKATRADIPGRPKTVTSVWDVMFQTGQAKPSFKKNDKGSIFGRTRKQDVGVYEMGRDLEGLMRKNPRLRKDVSDLYPLRNYRTEQERAQKIASKVFGIPNDPFGRRVYKKRVGSLQEMRFAKKKENSIRSTPADSRQGRLNRLDEQIYEELLGKEKK